MVHNGSTSSVELPQHREACAVVFTDIVRQQFLVITINHWLQFSNETAASSPTCSSLTDWNGFH